MKTSIYELLMYRNPQALADLDHYQRRWYDCCIQPPDTQFQSPVTLNTLIEPSEEIGQLMSQAPSRSRGDDDA